MRDPATDDEMENFINDIKLLDEDVLDMYKSKKLVKSEVNKSARAKIYKTFKERHCSEGLYAFQVSI